jgi:hypothetical protein
MLTSPALFPIKGKQMGLNGKFSKLLFVFDAIDCAVYFLIKRDVE